MDEARHRRDSGPRSDLEHLSTAPLTALPDSAAPGSGRASNPSVPSGPIVNTPQQLSAHDDRGAPAAQLPLNLILPLRPSTVAETGLDLVLLEELTLRHIVAAGLITGGDLAKKLLLPLAGVIEEAINSLRKDGLIDYQSGNNPVLGLAGMRLRATERGAHIDRLAREQNGYIGPAPVSLGSFERMLRQQAMTRRSVTRPDIRRGLAHLVLTQDIGDRVGAAIETGGPVLLHGHAGNGKTTLAAAMARLFSGAVLVPHAVVIDGHIVRVLDPSVHRPLRVDASVGGGKLDERWVCCQTPFVRASVEMELHQLELHFNQQYHYYDCPLQLKAAGGVLFLDDLGLQNTRVDDILYRLFEPYTKGIDYLTTIGGQQVSFPFTPLLVFATARDPLQLLGEALLRWIPCKIEVPDPTREQYAELLRRACAAAGIEYTQAGFDHIMDRSYTGTGRQPRASHPVQVVRLVCAAARYLESQPQLVPRFIDLAVDMYFA